MEAEITRISVSEVLLVENPTKLSWSNIVTYFPHLDYEFVSFRYSCNVSVNNSFVFPQRNSPPQTAQPEMSNYVITQTTTPYKMCNDS